MVGRSHTLGFCLSRKVKENGGWKGAGLVSDGEDKLPVGFGVSEGGAKKTVGEDVVCKVSAVPVTSGFVFSEHFV